MARETRAIWAARVARWERSGVDAATFARRERCSARTLTHWRWRLRKIAADPTCRASVRAVSFVEVVAASRAEGCSRHNHPFSDVALPLPAPYPLRGGFGATAREQGTGREDACGAKS
jgi:hypothetical protein